MFTKEFVIQRLQSANDEVRSLLSELSPTQKESIQVHDNWTVKDVIAHLSAWNCEAIEEIDRILKNQATWHDLFLSHEKSDEFNKREVEKRKDKSYEEIIQEWEESCIAIINKVQNLTDEEWQHESKDHWWQFGTLKDTPMSVWSLFDYGDECHESSHVDIVKKSLGLI